jgi:predicted phage terminase large subunit-like protein
MTQNLQLSRQEAAKTLLQRRAIRRSLTEWARFKGFEPARHHEVLIRELEALATGDSRNLAFCLPPGSAKSTYGSVLFPSWWLAQPQAGHIIAASHTVTLAEKFGRRIRNTIREDAKTLGYSVRDDNAAAGRWETTRGHEYLAAGVGTAISGFRGKLGLIDDPVAGREQADSETYRDAAWNWYLDDFTNRLIPGARQLVIMTRWHEDDLLGRILNGPDAKNWRVVSIPAIAEADDPIGRKPGEFLWPGDYGYAELLKQRKQTMPGRSWSALYQQRPQPDEGGFFRREWFKRYDTAPSPLRLYGASDYAVTDSGGDYTVHYVWGVDAKGDLYFVDRWAGQATADVWIDAQLDLIAKHKPLAWFGESGVIKRAVEPLFLRMSRERKIYVRQEWEPPIHDKPTRARGLQGRMSMGRAHWPNAPWVEEVMSDFLTFPAGKHDDDIDAAALAGLVLDRAHPAIVQPTAAQTRPNDRYRRAQQPADSWRIA